MCVGGGGFSHQFPPHIICIRSELCNRGIPFIYFPNSTTISATSPCTLRTFSTRAGIPWLKQHWINSIPMNTPVLYSSVSFFVFLLKVTVPFIFSFLLLRYCASFSNIIKTSPLTICTCWPSVCRNCR